MSWKSLCWIIVLSGTLPVVAVAGDVVTVHVTSGRKFTGEVDPKTNEHSLWLRSGKPQSFVRRQIEWNRVDHVDADGKSLTIEAFRRKIVSPNWKWAGDPFADDSNQSAPSTAEEIPAPRATFTGRTHRLATWQPPTPVAIEPLPRVVALHIDAYVANWDSDVEVDGIVVHVYPLDADGNTVPALGTLDVDLTGQATTNLIAGNPFPPLGYWSQVVRPEDMGTNGVVLRLPFQWVNPEFNLTQGLGSFGMVHARLTVAGQGIFEDTAAFTRIRPYSPVRDRLQQQRGTRFLPQEFNGSQY